MTLIVLTKESGEYSSIVDRTSSTFTPIGPLPGDQRAVAAYQ
jgi:hypothetical protein